MSKPKESVRIFKMSDTDMLQMSRVFYNLFLEDVDLFTAVDPNLGVRFSGNWIASITAAEDAARDMMLLDELTGYTAAVEAKMEACRVHFQQMKYFIEKAFPDNLPVQNAFGFDDYVKMRDSETKLMQFMKTLHSQAVKHSAELIAFGYTQEKIDRIATLWQELLDADQAQENFKKDRPVLTQQRIDKLNAAWEFVITVNSLSKIVFADNFAKLEQYYLPEERTTTPAEPTPAE